MSALLEPRSTLLFKALLKRAFLESTTTGSEDIKTLFKKNAEGVVRKKKKKKTDNKL